MAMLKALMITAMCASLSLSGAVAGEFRHVVFFKFKPEATPEQVKEIEKAFAELPSKIPTVVRYEWGTSESVEKLNDGYTHCFLVTFKDKAGLEAYLPSEAHKAFGEKLKPLMERAFVFDYTAREN